MLFHILRHIHSHERLVVVEHKLRESFWELGLTNTCWSKEKERADWAVWIGDAGARTFDCVWNFLDGVSLPYNTLLKFCFYMSKLPCFLFKHFCDRNPRPASHDLRYVMLHHFLFQNTTRWLELFQTRDFRNQIFFKWWNASIANLRGKSKVSFHFSSLCLQTRSLQTLLDCANVLNEFFFVFPLNLYFLCLLAKVTDFLINLFCARFCIFAGITLNSWLLFKGLFFNFKTHYATMCLLKNRRFVFKRNAKWRRSLVYKVHCFVW